MNERPQAARAIAKATLIPAIYATRIPGTWSAGKAWRISVAPVRTTRPGLTPGALLGNLATRVLTKAAWAELSRRPPPALRKT